MLQMLESTLSVSAMHAQLGRLEVHDHICCLYSDPTEQALVVARYLEQGLEKKERCIYMDDRQSADQVLRKLSDQGIDVDQHLSRRSLIIYSKEQPLLKRRYFKVDEFINFWQDLARQTVEEHFPAMRVAAEMTWALEPGVDSHDLIELESLLNNAFDLFPITGFCQYNVTRFEPSIIRAMLQTHPTIFYKDTAAACCFYAPPDEFLPESPLDLPLETLVDTIIQIEHGRDSHAHAASPKAPT